MDALRDAFEARRAVPDRIHAGHVGEQHLRGADVRIGLLAADVLLARLQGHAQGRLATGILRHADDAAGHRALVLVQAGEEGGVRAAVAHRHAKALAGTEGDVGAHRARGFRQHQRHQVAGDGADGVLRLELRDHCGEVLELALRIGRLQQRAEDVVVGSFLRRAEDQLEAEPGGAGAHHVEGLREGVFIDEEGVALRLARAARHGHRLGGGGRLVEQRGVGELHASQVDHHLLIVEQGFEAALGDLGLIGRVGGVPAGILEQVALDHRRRVGAVVAEADQRLPDLVPVGVALELRQRGMLVHRWAEGPHFIPIGGQADAGGDGLGDQFGTILDADGGAHRRLFGGIRADVARDELVAAFEFVEGHSAATFS